MKKNEILLTSLQHFAMAFNGMSLNDFVLFKYIAFREGVSHEQLLNSTKFEEKNIQASLRKLTGSRLVSNAHRYRLVKDVQGVEEVRYYLTARGKEYLRL